LTAGGAPWHCGARDVRRSFCDARRSFCWQHTVSGRRAAQCGCLGKQVSRECRGDARPSRKPTYGRQPRSWVPVDIICLPTSTTRSCRARSRPQRAVLPLWEHCGLLAFSTGIRPGNEWHKCRQWRSTRPSPVRLVDARAGAPRPAAGPSPARPCAGRHRDRGRARGRYRRPHARPVPRRRRSDGRRAARQRDGASTHHGTMACSKAPAAPLCGGGGAAPTTRLRLWRVRRRGGRAVAGTGVAAGRRRCRCRRVPPPPHSPTVVRLTRVAAARRWRRRRRRRHNRGCRGGGSAALRRRTCPRLQAARPPRTSYSCSSSWAGGRPSLRCPPPPHCRHCVTHGARPWL